MPRKAIDKTVAPPPNPAKRSKHPQPDPRRVDRPRAAIDYIERVYREDPLRVILSLMQHISAVENRLPVRTEPTTGSITSLPSHARRLMAELPSEALKDLLDKRETPGELR